MEDLEDIYTFLLALILIYNNSLVLLGPTAWGTGVGPRRSFIIAVAGQLLGISTSHMSHIHVETSEFLYIAALYTALSIAKISIPISIVGYAIYSLRPDAVILWLTSPTVSLIVFPLCKLLKRSDIMILPSLFLLMYVFGYNNVALFSRNIPLATLAVVVGTYLGLGFSRWVADLVALRPRTVVAINLATIIGAFIGISFNIPVSFTLVAYSAMLVASLSSSIRLIKIEKFVRTYVGIIIALIAAAIFPALKSLLLSLV